MAEADNAFDHLRPPLPPLPPPPPPPPPPGDEPLALDPFLPIVGPDGMPRLNKVAIRVYTKFMDELAEFVQIQDKVVGQRVEVQEMRKKLSIYRKNVSKCDIDFMDHLRICMAEGRPSTDPQLQKLYLEAQQARDIVGPLEDDYEALEVKLGASEFALQMEYDNLEGRYKSFFKLHATSTTMGAPSSIDFEDPSNHAGSLPEEMEPRDTTLLYGRKIGEAVEVGQLPVAVDVSAGPSPGITPIPSTQRADPSGRISSDMRDMARRDEPTSSGHDHPELAHDDDFFGLTPEDTPSDWHTADVRTHVLQSVGERELPAISEAPEVLTELIATPDIGAGDGLYLVGSDTDTRSTLSDYLMDFSSTKSRVNRWLLHKLRVSPWEVFELQRRVSSSANDVPDWTALALRLWEDESFDSILSPVSPSPHEMQESFHQGDQSRPAPYPAVSGRPRSKRRDRHQRASLSTNPAFPADADDDLENKQLPHVDIRAFESLNY